MLLRAALTALLLLCSAGCAEILPTEIGQIERGGTSLRPLLDPDSIAVPGTDTAAVTDLLGEPDEAEERKPSKNQRPGTVHTLRYDGLELVVRELRKPERAFISDMTVTSREYVTELPFRVGAQREDVETALGEPLETDGDDVIYALNEDRDRCVVTYDDGRASSMTFQFR